jgi:hypothetical protein
MGGWVGGRESGDKDCLQQSKTHQEYGHSNQGHIPSTSKKQHLNVIWYITID